MEDEEIKGIKNDIENEVKSIKDRRILILILLYSRKLNVRHKERERL